MLDQIFHFHNTNDNVDNSEIQSTLLLQANIRFWNNYFMFSKSAFVSESLRLWQLQWTTRSEYAFASTGLTTDLQTGRLSQSFIIGLPPWKTVNVMKLLMSRMINVIATRSFKTVLNTEQSIFFFQILCTNHTAYLGGSGWRTRWELFVVH